MEEHIAFTFMRNIVLTRDQPVFAMNSDKGKRIVSDANLFWDAGGETRLFGETKEDQGSLEEWKEKTGNDRNSLVADPCFENPEAGMYRLSEDSPAYRLGFQDIDMTDVGPRSWTHHLR